MEGQMADGLDSRDDAGLRTTESGIPLKEFYTAADVRSDKESGIGSSPGSAPYLRSAYKSMYRTRPWRIFQLSGFGNPEDEGERIRFLLAHGETGFIMEHDRNTADHLYDVDHPEVSARREDVGMTGAVILGVRDYETVLEGIPIERTYAHPGGGVVQHGPFALANFWTVAQRRGIDLNSLSGTGQSDFFLTYLGCITKQQVPARAGLRLNCDIIEFCTEHMPHWVPVSIAGYNGADTGLNAYQELGAVMANAIEYFDEILRRGRFSADDVARGIGGVSFRTSMDLFEDVAKLRAARRMWHWLLTERYGVTDERALRLRIHSLTAGFAMAYQQPLNNLIRGTIMGLAAALGGTQSLGVSGYDEAISIPSEHAHQMSVRIQQVLQKETGVTSVIDPLGGSYFVEALTDEVEQRAKAFMQEILDQGGFIEALDTGWLHRTAERNQVLHATRLEAGISEQVGVNMATDDVGLVEIDGFQSPSNAWDKAMERLIAVRSTRDAGRHGIALAELEQACRSDENIMPRMMNAVASDATLGDIGNVFREVFGDWDSPVKA
jgi:methylmalonyl-CoA mutase N-terminal domain/subunit